MSLDDVSDSLLQLVPESIARENLIIPIYSEPRSMTVAYADSLGPGIDDIHEKLEFVFERKVKCLSFPEAQIRSALDRHYPPAAKVENCGWKFKFQCPQRWHDLVKGQDAFTRFCPVCSQNVHLCTGDEDLVDHARMGHCVATLDQRGGVNSEFLGELAIDFTSDG